MAKQLIEQSTKEYNAAEEEKQKLYTLYQEAELERKLFFILYFVFCILILIYSCLFIFSSSSSSFFL